MRPIIITLAAIAGAALYLLLALPFQQRVVAAVLCAAAILWFTEALPLWITALALPAAFILFGHFEPSVVFAPFFHPVVVLLFGGLVLALSIQKYGIDQHIVYYLMRFSRKPRYILLAVMLAAFSLSMWIPNTAATAIILPITLTILGNKKSAFEKALLLGVGYGATLGGTTTIVGTPPSAITVGTLAQQGVRITFFDWIIRAFPPAFLTLLLGWAILWRLWGRGHRAVVVRPPRLTADAYKVASLFGLIVLLWLTEPITGIHYSVTAVLAVIVLFGSGLLKKDDLGRINWSALILVGGGLCLGRALTLTHLDALMAEKIAMSVGHLPHLGVLLTIAFFSIAFTAFAANTASAAILVPLMIPLAARFNLSPAVAAMLAGIAVSYDFVVPVGTPPNAIVYSTGRIRVVDMVKAGILLSVVGGIILTLFSLLW